MAFADVFLLLTVLFVAFIFALPLIRKPRSGGAGDAGGIRALRRIRDRPAFWILFFGADHPRLRATIFDARRVFRQF